MKLKTKIKLLNLKKSIGPKSIPTKLSKKYSKTISIPISKLINQSLVTGIFPAPLKLASLILNFKKADPQKCTNYGPISLTPNITKNFLISTRFCTITVPHPGVFWYCLNSIAHQKKCAQKGFGKTFFINICQN